MWLKSATALNLVPLRETNATSWALCTVHPHPAVCVALLAQRPQVSGVPPTLGNCCGPPPAAAAAEKLMSLRMPHTQASYSVRLPCCCDELHAHQGRTSGALSQPPPMARARLGVLAPVAVDAPRVAPLPVSSALLRREDEACAFDELRIIDLRPAHRAGVPLFRSRVFVLLGACQM